MKRLIAVLAVTAVVAGAAFAQEGSWSVGSSGSIGTSVDFTPMEVFGGHATNQLTGYDWRGASDMRGNFGLTYRRGSLSAGLDFNQTGITAKLSFSGENFQFSADSDLRHLIGISSGGNFSVGSGLAALPNKAGTPSGTDNPISAVGDLFGGTGLGTFEVTAWEATYYEYQELATAGTPGTFKADSKPVRVGFQSVSGSGSVSSWNNSSRSALWGSYTFQVLNGVRLEAAVVRTGQQWWSVTDIFGDTFSHTGHDGQWDGRNRTNYLLVDAGLMEGLSVGFVTPGVFGSARGDFLERSLKQTVFGARFASGPFQAALQFALRGDSPSRKEWKEGDLQSALYFSTQYQINDQMKASLEFRGAFGNQFYVTKGDFGGWGLPSSMAAGAEDDEDGSWEDNMEIKIGARFDFNSGDFGASMVIKYEDNTAAEHGVLPVGLKDDDDDFDYFEELFKVKGSVVGINPSVSYVLVPGYLKFDFGFQLSFFSLLDIEATMKATDGKPVYTGVMDYWFQPSLAFNFLGTGAGGFDTGIVMRYRASGPKVDLKNGWTGYFDPTKGRNDENFFEIMFGWRF